MILVDTSVWISHFREGNKNLVELLEDGHVITHPFIIGELVCGNIKNRKLILSLLENLPMAGMAKHEEVMEFIESHRPMGKDLGHIDIQLLASAKLTGVQLWTLDKRLQKVALKLEVIFSEEPWARVLTGC